MKVALFVPCYVDQLYPSVAIATLELLEKYGINVSYPTEQVCCGQPAANAGFEHLTLKNTSNFIRNFSEFDYVVSPSGSCVLNLIEHLKLPAHQSASTLKNRIFELSEFLVDILKVKEVNSSFPFRVGLHLGCHGLRGLMLSGPSELMIPSNPKTETLLRMVKGLELVNLNRKDECCGFGGTFCVSEEAVSVKMGKDRVTDHIRNGAEYITGNDMSCLMHLDGILKRKQSNVKTIHLAEILNGSQ